MENTIDIQEVFDTLIHKRYYGFITQNESEAIGSHRVNEFMCNSLNNALSDDVITKDEYEIAWGDIQDFLDYLAKINHDTDWVYTCLANHVRYISKYELPYRECGKVQMKIYNNWHQRKEIINNLIEQYSHIKE